MRARRPRSRRRRVGRRSSFVGRGAGDVALDGDRIEVEGQLAADLEGFVLEVDLAVGLGDVEREFEGDCLPSGMVALVEVTVSVLDDDLRGFDGLVLDRGDGLGVDVALGNGVGDVGLDVGDFEGDRGGLLVGRLVVPCGQDERRPGGDDREDEADGEEVDDVDGAEDSALVVDEGHNL